MSKRFGRNQRRRMREEIAANQRACSEQYRRAERLARELRESIVISLEDIPYDTETCSMPVRVAARYGGEVLKYQHNVEQRSIVILRQGMLYDFSEKLARMIYEKLRRT